MSLPSKMLSVMMTPEIMLMVSKVYVPVLFPLTFAIGWTAITLDQALGFGQGFLPSPANYAIAVLTFVAGVLLWALTYTDLVSMGDGSPSPTAGETQTLVVKGVYAYCRNPSVHGKLVGVLAVGFAINSFSFCFLLLPPILAVSLVEKVIRQEPQLLARFGDDYVDYRKHVPLFIPRLTPWRPEPRGLS